jgi:hypothetical protein
LLNDGCRRMLASGSAACFPLWLTDIEVLHLDWQRGGGSQEHTGQVVTQVVHGILQEAGSHYSKTQDLSTEANHSVDIPRRRRHIFISNPSRGGARGGPGPCTRRRVSIAFACRCTSPLVAIIDITRGNRRIAARRIASGWTVALRRVVRAFIAGWGRGRSSHSVVVVVARRPRRRWTRGVITIVSGRRGSSPQVPTRRRRIVVAVTSISRWIAARRGEVIAIRGIVPSRGWRRIISGWLDTINQGRLAGMVATAVSMMRLVH